MLLQSSFVQFVARIASTQYARDLIPSSLLIFTSTPHLIVRPHHLATDSLLCSKRYQLPLDLSQSLHF